MSTVRADGNTSPQGSATTQDPIGPHGSAPPHGGRVEGGGTEGTPPLSADDGGFDADRDRSVRTGDTANAKGGDSAPLGAPAEIQSDRIGPSDPDRRGPAT